MPPRAEPSLPEALRACLAGFRSRWRRRIAADACARAGVAAGVSFLLVFAMDRAGYSPAWVRFLVLAAGVVAVALAGQQAWRRFAECGGALAAARLIARAQPAVGEKLLGAVELAAAGGDGTSPCLRKAVMESVSAEMAGVDFHPSLPQRNHAARCAFVLTGAIIAVVAVCFPRESANSLARLRGPFENVERFVRAKMEPVPAVMIVPWEESSVVILRLAADAADAPVKASATSSSFRIQAERDAERCYRFPLPALRTPAAVNFRSGDFRHRATVVPTRRPAPLAIRARIFPPVGRGGVERVEDASSGAIQAVEGSRVAFEIELDRKVARAEWGGGNPVEIAARTLRLPEMEVGKTMREIPVSWVDPHGLGGGGFTLRIEMLEARPPPSPALPPVRTEESDVVRENGVRRILPRAPATIRVSEEYQAALEYYQRAAEAGR